MSLQSLNDLIINPKTRKYLEAYLKSLAHTLLLTGPTGIGLGTIAQVLAREIASANVITIKPTLHKQQKTANINMSDVKSIQKSLANKRRASFVVIIDEVDKMTASTPETLLKLLEEPVDNVHFILTTHNMFNIPPTITSRSQTINFLPSDTEKLLENIKLTTKKNQIQFMAKGFPAETIRLIEDEEYFRANARLFEDVKKFINFSTYDRLIMISKIKDRDEAKKFMESLAKITAMSITKLKKTENLTLLSDVIERLSKNGNLKAQLTYLAVNF